MFLKKFDWISPPITLFFKGEASHVSIYSGLLSIVAYIIVVAAIIFYALNFINRESPKAYFFTRYVDDAGTFPVNSTQMFHFIQVSDPATNQKVPLDFASFRIVGFDDAYSDNYMKDPGPSIVKTKNHWVYGNCNNNSDTEGISYLIDQKYYEQSGCIRKYYDADKKKYFETGEEGFRWPVILKGCSNPDRTYYGIIIQRCDEANEFLQENGGPPCKESSEIDKVISSISFNFQIIDHYADMLNYEMPFTKYFYEVTSAIDDGIFRIQHMNFNPATMLTHNGFFFENQVIEHSYFFTQNEKQTIEDTKNATTNQVERTTSGCLIGVYFWMQNTLQYYERNYDRIQDILSDIGGISSIVLTIAGLLNLLIYNFIVILDTEVLTLNLEKEISNSRELSKRPTILKKANNVMFPPRRPYQERNKSYVNDQQDPQSSNYQRLMKDGVDIHPNINSKDEQNEQNNNLYLKRNNILNEANKEGNYGNYQQNNIQNSRAYGGGRGGQIYNRGNNQQGDYNENNSYQRNLKDETIMKKKDEDNKSLERHNFHWCKYLGYLICCGRNNKRMTYYEEFRAKLISEENIIKNYMDTYKLLKVCNIQKTELVSKED